VGSGWPAVTGRFEPFASSLGTAAICAQRPAGVDVERSLGIAAVEVAAGQLRLVASWAHALRSLLTDRGTREL
jgi:hypothetical protein